MNLHLLAFLAIAALAGVGIGYYLRLIISLGQKGSMELEIKKTMIDAKEEAQRILDEAKKKAEDRVEELKNEEKKKEKR
jgi:hypothetical protein